MVTEDYNSFYSRLLNANEMKWNGGEAQLIFWMVPYVLIGTGRGECPEYQYNQFKSQIRN